jgi:hypothetical protein
MMRRIMGKYLTQPYKDEGLGGVRKMLAIFGMEEARRSPGSTSSSACFPRARWEGVHLGVKVTPVTDGYTGLFDVAKVLRAAQRGAACMVDLSDHWDPFAVADAPLEQIRAEYGVPAL